MKNFILTLFLVMSLSLAFGQSPYQEYHAQGIMNVNLSQTLNADGIQVSKNKPTGKYAVRSNIGINDIIQTINKSSNSEFRLKKITSSRLQVSKKSHQFDQYFDNVRIEGGFLSVVVSDSKVLAIYPKVFEGINISTLPSFSIKQIESKVIKQTVIKSELVISPRFGNYKLVWKISYSEKDMPIEAWIDAHTGEILDEVEHVMNLEGQTQTYGTQVLNDNTQGGVTTLETPDGTIQVFSNGSFNCSVWDDNDILSTTNTTDWGQDASDHCVQSFHAATEIVPTFSCLGIDFGNVHVDCGLTLQNAFSNLCSTVDETYIRFGTMNGTGTSIALYDVMGHELAHTYLLEFLDYTNPQGNEAIHEGLADVFGTFTESKVSGLDWVIGDDEPEVSN